MVTQVANIRAGSEPQLIWPQTLLSLHCTIFMRRSEVKLLSCVQLFATPWTVAYQSPLSMGLSRQEYWSGLPFPSPEDDLPGPGIKPTSLMSPVLAGRFFTSSATWEATTDPWVGLKNTMVSERSQAGKTGYYMIPLHEASRKSKATDTESRRRVAWGWRWGGEQTANSHELLGCPWWSSG